MKCINNVSKFRFSTTNNRIFAGREAESSESRA